MVEKYLSNEVFKWIRGFKSIIIGSVLSLFPETQLKSNLDSNSYSLPL